MSSLQTADRSSLSLQRLLTSCALCFLVSSAPAAGAAHDVTLWRVDGTYNSVYLLGSVHLLRKSDYPLPQILYDAYEDAGTLIMELDMDDLDPLATQSLINELGIAKGDTGLRELMGARLYEQAEQQAQRIDIPLAMLGRAEPWFAALTVENLLLMRIGFNPGYGLEMHLAQRAGGDGKEILGLETERQQLEILDGLPLKAQRQMLLQTLDEGAEIEAIMDDMIAAWRGGDIEFLEQNMLGEIREHRELFNAMVVERNRTWVKQIRKLLTERENYLVVVGALHLVGDIGLPSSLRELGYEVLQLREVD